MLASSRAGLVSVDSNFERNWRRKQEIRCRPYADAIYRKQFGNVKVERFEREDNYMLDKEFAMDVRLIFPNGMILTGQEKFLSEKYSRFRSMTVEHLQNPQTNEPGDWFKLAVQFYFVGYETSGGFFPWVMVNWPALVLATVGGRVKWHDQKNTDGHARASFKFCYMDELPDDCILAKSLKPTAFE